LLGGTVVAMEILLGYTHSAITAKETLPGFLSSAFVVMEIFVAWQHILP
jgi:hypothetical protein